MITSANRFPPLPGDGQRAPTNSEVRTLFREWQARNRWPFEHISNALRAWGLSNIPGSARLEAFLQSGMQSLHEDSLRSLWRFVLTFPNPAPFEELIEQLLADRAVRVMRDHQRPMRETLARERERVEYRQYWLSREPAPNGRPARRTRPSNPLFGLDKATISALSGGTL